MSQYLPPNQKPLADAPTFIDVMWRYKYYLVFYVIAISFLSFTGLYLVGGVPEELKIVDQPTPPQIGENNSNLVASTTATSSLAETQSETEYPLRVIIDKIGVDTPVSNPTSTDNTILNNLLLKGAVRYPGSGTLGSGNMFIFGHNTGIRVVNNQAYKAFNHLKDLAVGDVIRVQSLGYEYNYKVSSVSLKDSSEAFVTFSNDKNMLTLSTCDVFGQKQDRYVVEATFIKSIPLE